MTSVLSRTYGDSCAVARALDVVGERWALLVVRELLFGPRRFTDLQAGVAGARPNVLSQRLRELEAAELVQRRRLGPPARAWVYELTARGRSLEPLLLQLGQWGRLLPAGGKGYSVDSLMLALKNHFEPARWGAGATTFHIVVHDEPFTVVADRMGLAVSRGEPYVADLTVYTDVETLTALVIDGRLPRQSGLLEIAGDTATFGRLLDALL
jgi:DNA-binding HxlR family transcriptional regulator